MSIKMKGHFENTESNITNSTFFLTKIKVHALGVNQNGSNITQDAYENAKNSLYGIPIIAKYTEENDNYGNVGDLTSHNVILKKDKDGNFILSHDTVPLGFVSPNANIETIILNEDGVDKTYITVDEVVLWKRYDSTQKIIEWLENDNIPSVSMEIGEVEGEISNDYFQINSYNYEAITCLGSNVEPCFPLSQVENYEKHDFNKLYKEMVNEYQEMTTQNQSSKDVDNIINEQALEGGNTMDISNLLQKYSLTNEQINFSLEGLTEEQIEVKMQEIVEFNKTPIVVKPVLVTEPIIEPTAEFELSNNQLETAIRQELAKRQVIVKDYWDENYLSNEFYLRDVKDGVSVVIDNNWENYYGIPYTVVGDFVTLNYDAKVAYISDWRAKVGADSNIISDNGSELFVKYSVEKAIEKTTEKVKTEFNVKETEEYKTVETECSEAKSQFEALNAEVITLREFKLNEENQKAFELRKVEVDKAISEFSFEEEEIKDIREKAYSSDQTIEELENSLFTLEGRKLHTKKQFSAKTVEKVVEKPVVKITEEPIVKSIYGSADKYFDKK